MHPARRATDLENCGGPFSRSTRRERDRPEEHVHGNRVGCRDEAVERPSVKALPDQERGMRSKRSTEGGKLLLQIARRIGSRLPQTCQSRRTAWSPGKRLCRRILIEGRSDTLHRDTGC